MKVSIGKNKKSIVVDHHDVWSMDFTLAHIILPCLMEYKEGHMGIPGTICSVGGESYDRQLSFDFYTESHDSAFNEKIKEWNEIIDKMIWSFQQIIYQNYQDQYHYGEWDMKFKDYEGDTSIDPLTGKPEKFFEMIPPDPQKYWTDFRGLTIHEERIQEGIDLFAKYYRGLWI